MRLSRMPIQLLWLASLIFVVGPHWVAAQDAKRIESDKAAKIAATLVAATSGLSDLPVKVTADTSELDASLKAVGTTGGVTNAPPRDPNVTRTGD